MFWHIQIYSHPTSFVYINKNRNINMNQQIHNALSNKFNILYCYDEHETMILYGNFFLVRIVCYKKPKCWMFLHNFQQNYTQSIANSCNLQIAKNANTTLHFYINFFIKMLTNCPTIIIGDFNVNMLTKHFYQQFYRPLWINIILK
jgi:hypothetical protein